MESYTRGGVFFALQASSGYMLFRTIGRVHEARDREARRVSIAVDSLETLMEEDTAAARRLSDPVAFQAAIDDDEPFSITPHLQLARYHERHRKDPAEALACLHRALQVVDRAARLAPAWAADERAKLGPKIERLERRVARLR